MNELDLFTATIAIKDDSERRVLLDRECAGNPELRKRLERLVAAHFEANLLLDQQAIVTVDRGRSELVGEMIAGRYKLLEEIGEGGMGTVWVAEQTEPVRRKVALKLIKAGMDSRSVLARFEAERQALAVMDHPNIAKVFDGGLTDAGRPYFVMEYVKGVPITEYCDATRLGVPERLNLFVQVCQAVQHAHQKGIIHRDLKPSNILVAPYDDKPVPKVIDFGLAKAMHQSLTEKTLHTAHETVLGTPLYMSPEQAQLNNIDVDTRSDIYSLGVLLYELLTGTTPLDKQRFKEAAWDEVKRIIREEEPLRPSMRLSSSNTLPSLAAGRQIEPAKLTKLVRGEIDWIVMKSLEKDRARRYETASGFAADVQRYLDGEPVVAVPPTWNYRLRKFYRKHQAALVTVLSVVVLLTSVTLFSIWQARRAIIAEAKAERQLAEAIAAQRAAKTAALAERTAKEREAEQRAKAERARDRTRQALDAMTSSITGDSLATQKAISDEQKKFLTEVLSYYKEFAGENADDERSRARTAAAASGVGLIEYRLGRFVESDAAFRQNRAGFEKLVAEFPDVPAYRENLAGSYINLGITLAGMGKWAEVEKTFQKAVPILEELVANSPAMARYRFMLAANHYNLGLALSLLGKRQEAVKQTRKAVPIQEKLVAATPAVPDYRRALAMSHSSLAKLLLDLGDQPASEEQNQKAMGILEKLASEFPAVPDYRAELATAYDRQPAGMETLRNARAILEELVAEFPAVPDYRRRLAQSYNGLAARLRAAGNWPGAEEQTRKAVAILEKLVAEFPPVPDYRHELGKSHNDLGLLLAEQQKRPEAEDQYRRAVAIQEPLADEVPAVSSYQVCLGCSYLNFGNLTSETGRPDEALIWFGKAIRTLTPEYEHEGRLAATEESLSYSHSGRAVAYRRLQKHAEALTDWDKAIAVCPKRWQPAGLRAGRAGSLVRVGQVAEAVAEVAELAKLPGAPPPIIYDYACVYAIASGKIADKKQGYADRAMELLQHAVKAGYKDAAHLKQDTDLDPLREREDFKKLLQELEKK